MSQAKPVTTPSAKRPPRTLAGTPPPQHDTDRAAAIASYEAAIRLMQQGKYDMAHAAFD
jgi:TolA-binding protein